MKEHYDTVEIQNVYIRIPRVNKNLYLQVKSCSDTPAHIVHQNTI